MCFALVKLKIKKSIKPVFILNTRDRFLKLKFFRGGVVKKKIIFLAGLPGVGKTILAQEMGKCGFYHLRLDKIKQQVVNKKKVVSEIDPPEIRREYYSKALAHIDSIDRETIVVDEVFHLSSLRQEITATCFSRGWDHLWVFITCPHQEVRRRLQGRKNHPILSSKQAWDMYRKMEEVFEYDGFDLSINTNSDDGIQNFINRIK